MAKTRSNHGTGSELGEGRAFVKVFPTPAYDGYINVVCPNDLSLHTVSEDMNSFKCPIDNVLLIWD